MLEERVMQLFASVVLATAICLSSEAFAQSLKADEVYSSVAVTAISDPIPVLGADDRVHLAYELVINNPSQVFVTLNKIEAVDDDGKVLGSLEGDALVSMLLRFGATGALLGPGSTAIAFMDVSFAKDEVLPANVSARISATRQVAGSDGQPQALPSDYPLEAEFSFKASPVSPANLARMVESPLRGDGWVSVNGCCDAITSHRGAIMSINGRLRVPERFAIDWVQIDKDGQLFKGDPNSLESFAFYGTPIHSVADGVVVNLYDEADEQVPNQEAKGITTASIGGNMMVIDVGEGAFAFYAHLQRGSLKFELGDKVRAGDVIGLLGNTGNSSAPHLHFHLMDGPSPLNANGLPFVLSRFSSPGVLPEAEEENLFNGKPVKLDERLSGEHAHQLPLNNQVVNFE